MRYYYESDIARSKLKQLLEIFLRQLSFAHNETGQLVQNLVKLNIIFVLSQTLVIAQLVAQLTLAVQQLVQISQKQFKLADVAALLVLADTLHKDFVYALETGDKVAVHILYFGVFCQEFGQVGVWMKIMVVAHEILAQEDAGIESAPHFWVDLVSVVHQFLQLFGQCDHPLCESRQQFLDQIEIFVVFFAFYIDSLSLEIVKRHLEVNLLEILHKPLCFPMFVKFHSNETALQILIYLYSNMIVSNHYLIKLANCCTHINLASIGKPKSVLVLLPQISLKTSWSLQNQNWVWTYFMSLIGIYMVGLDFRVRQECTPSFRITMQRYYQVPIICDFLQILSQMRAPSAKSLNYYAFSLLSSGSLIDFESNFILRNFRKISINLSLLLLYKLRGQLITTSSSFPMPTLSLLTGLEPSSPQLKESRLILMKGNIFLLISNSLSKNTSQVQDTNFLSYNVTVYLFCSAANEDFSDDFPFDFLTSIFLAIFCQPISSYQLLLSCQSDEEVPNSSFLILIISFLRLIFILMYQS